MGLILVKADSSTNGHSFQFPRVSANERVDCILVHIIRNTDEIASKQAEREGKQTGGSRLLLYKQAEAETRVVLLTLSLPS